VLTDAVIFCATVCVNVRYLDVNLRLLTFDGARNHPAHVRRLVHSHLTVLHLTHIIRAETSVATSRVFIYPDRSPDTEPLPEEQSLEQCGFVGGPQGAPIPLLLYYDYSVDIGSGCPLLTCDHYFGQRKARVHRITSSLPALSSTGSPTSTSSARQLSASNSLLSVRGGSRVSFNGRQMSAGHLTA